MAPSSPEVIDLIDSDDDNNNNNNNNLNDKKPPAQPVPGRKRKRHVPFSRNNNNMNNHEVINLCTDGCYDQRRRQNMLAFQAREQANLFIDINDSDDENDDDDDDDDDIVWIPSSLATTNRNLSHHQTAIAVDPHRQVPMALKNPIQEDKSAAADQKLALSLQRLEEEAAKQSKKEEQELMYQTPTGKAYAMVDRILRIVEQKTIPRVAAAAASRPVASNQLEDIEAVQAIAQDDMVFMAEKLFQLQETFKTRQIDTTVDIGYHYTGENHYKQITENGLMTKSEREQHGKGSHTNGQVYGEGIYTANNPFGFRNFGAVYVN